MYKMGRKSGLLHDIQVRVQTELSTEELSYRSSYVVQAGLKLVASSDLPIFLYLLFLKH